MTPEDDQEDSQIVTWRDVLYDDARKHSLKTFGVQCAIRSDKELFQYWTIYFLGYKLWPFVLLTFKVCIIAVVVVLVLRWLGLWR
jgi:hypothetical protein